MTKIENSDFKHRWRNMENYQMKILIVDDDRSNLEVLSHILKTSSADCTADRFTKRYMYIQDDNAYTESAHLNYKLCVAKSGHAALKKAIDEKPDLILLDIMMPDMSGFEVLIALKNADATRNIPVIFITGMDSVESEERGFSLGAVDYITKPFHSSLVKARVRTHLRIVEQIHTIEMLGLIDTLTNISNRRGFDNMIASEWGRAIREKKTISLLMIDIDNFKIFNDSYGHLQGDVVLQTIAKVLTKTLKRHSDFAARWGGEEFIVILPDTDMDGARMVADNIKANIETSKIQSINRTSPFFNVTVSIGIASENPDINSMITDFIEQADKALYAAKKAGKNRVCS